MWCQFFSLCFKLASRTLFIFPRQSQRQSGHISLSLSLGRDDDSTLTLITQFPPLIEQFYYKIDRSAPNTIPHSCIYININLYASLLTQRKCADCFMSELKTILETSLAAERLLCVSDFSSAPPFIIARRGSNCTFDYYMGRRIQIGFRNL